MARRIKAAMKIKTENHSGLNKPKKQENKRNKK
jgi:hypothetical protein